MNSRTTNGNLLRNVYEPVRLELMGRHGDFGVVDVDESVPNLLGQIPLEYLDLVVDSKAQVLRPNPEHGDKQMSEEYRAICLSTSVGIADALAATRGGS